MKKVLLFLLFFVSAITFSDTLKNISYSNGKVIGTFRENNQIKPNASVTKLGNEDILMLSFPNSEMESSVQAFINQNDQYISKVYTAQRNGMVVVYVYLKPSVTYQVVSRTGEFQVTLDGGQTASRNNSSQTSRYTTTQRQSTANTQTAQTQKQPNTSTGNKKYTIVVDAGHGGHDSGARGNGYNEKDIALQVATRLANNLRRFENKVDGSYGDVPFSDFILNDIFYRKNQKTSQAIAESVLDGLINLTGLRRRGVFGANFAVLRGSNSPSILVELGFMNNYSDLSHYLTPEGQESAASTIGNAIRKFFK